VRPIYIGQAYRYPPNVAFYMFFSTNISTEYFKHAAHSVFLFKMPFISQCYLFLVYVLFTFYTQGVLKFKCKTPVPKG